MENNKIMETNKRNCPKCGFPMKETYCVKCGYYEGESVSDINKYKTETSSLQTLLKNEYQKIIYNKNSIEIFLLGPLYFGYYNCIFQSIIGIIIEFLLLCIIGMSHNGDNILIFICLIINRALYVILGNTLLLKILNNKIIKVKRKNPNTYKEILFNEKEKSILNLIASLLFYILIIIIWIIIYRYFW